MAIGLHRPLISANTGGWGVADGGGYGDRLLTNEGGIGKSVHGRATGSSLIEIDQGKAARMIPIPSQRLS